METCSKKAWWLALQYRMSRRHDLGRPNKRWKDHENFQDQDEQALMDLKPNCSWLLRRLYIFNRGRNTRRVICASQLVHNRALLELSSSETQSEMRDNYSRCQVQLRTLACDSEHSYGLLSQIPTLKPVKLTFKSRRPLLQFTDISFVRLST